MDIRWLFWFDDPFLDGLGMPVLARRSPLTIHVHGMKSNNLAMEVTVDY